MQHRDRILVTGATGFIGGRLVERLARDGQSLRVVTSDFRRCARVARFPVELVKADLSNPRDFARTVEGCSAVYHLAYRFGQSPAEHQVNLSTTRALAEAAVAHGIRRFVHFSSVSAYGLPMDGDLTENTSPRPSRDPYCETKRRIDEMLRELHARKGLAVSILQPTIVYGPYGGTWTAPLVSLVASSRVLLPASDSGLCNAVYVDDVVNAAILAARSEAAVGESFLVSAAEPVSWRAFFGAYERMAGTRAVVSVDDDALREQSRAAAARPGLVRTLQRALARRPELRERLLDQPPLRWVRGAARMLPAAVRQTTQRWGEDLWHLPTAPATPTYIPDPATLALYSAKTHVRIDKARRVLGYSPEFDLEGGMARTALWARWANLAP